MIIIVVDDEEIILSGETAVIRQCAPGAEVHGFSSPNQALEYLRAYSADVAFLDLEMPGINGLELARLMKAVAPRLNIIFATAYREYAEKATNLRASGYLLKPITADRIREELENLRYLVSKNKNGLFVRQSTPKNETGSAADRRSLKEIIHEKEEKAHRLSALSPVHRRHRDPAVPHGQQLLQCGASVQRHRGVRG